MEKAVCRKAVIYARYSSEKQSEMSIEGQIREIRAFAEQEGYTIIGVYIDRALTGKIDARPDFQRMIKDSGKGLFNYVIVYTLDRFSRNKYDSAIYKYRLKENGVKVLSAKEHIADDAYGVLSETILEGMAEFYVAELSQKVRRGMTDGFLKGHSSGSRCYGYDLVAVQGTAKFGRIAKTFVINKAESEIVRLIFDKYTGGERAKDILAWLKLHEIKSTSGGYFTKTGIMYLLKNKKYIGVLSFGDQSRENAVPAIIDRATFDKAQKRINLNKHSAAIFKARERFLLSTKTYCGYCKKPMVSDTGTSRHGIVYRYYKCFTKKYNSKPCESEQINKTDIENAVINATMDLLRKNGMLERIAKGVVAYNDAQSANPKLDLYEQQLKDVNKQLNNFLYAIGQGIITANTKERMLELESEKANLEYRIDTEKLNAQIKLDYNQIMFWLQQFTDGDTQDDAFRERIIDAFVNKVIVWNNRMIITYNINGADNDKISVEQILTDFYNAPQGFNLEQIGRGYKN